MTAATAATITTATAVVIRMSGSVMAERLSGVVPVLVGGGAEFAGVAVAGGMERVVPGVAVLRVGVRFGEFGGLYCDVPFGFADARAGQRPSWCDRRRGVNTRRGRGCRSGRGSGCCMPYGSSPARGSRGSQFGEPTHSGAVGLRSTPLDSLRLCAGERRPA